MFRQERGLVSGATQFSIDDAAHNTGESEEYTVEIVYEASTTDAVIALAIAAGSREYDPCMDVSGDGQVTSLDALMILQVAGSEP